MSRLRESVTHPLASTAIVVLAANSIIGCSGRMLLATMSDGDPVYNVVFRERVLDEPHIQLPNLLPNSVNFFIGYPAQDNALNEASWTVDSSVLAGPEAVVPLTVTFACFICAEGDLQKQGLNFHRDLGVSNPARFFFVPDLALADENGHGRITFSVSRQGIEIDHIAVDVWLETPPVEAAVQPAASLSTLETYGEREPDLELTIQAERNNIVVILQPIDPELEELFAKRHLTPSGAFKQFETGTTAAGLDEVVGRAYLSLRAAMENDSLLEKALSGGMDNTSLFGLDSIRHSSATAALRRAGATLHARLFPDRAPILRDLMYLVEDIDVGRPLRIRVNAKGIHLPWQILHPRGPLDIDSFWGVRYELGVVSLTEHGRSRLPSQLTLRGDTAVLFGRYRGPSSDSEPAARLADHQAVRLRELLQDHAEVKEVDSSVAFLDEIKRRANQLALVITYTHGAGPTKAMEVDGTLVIVRDPAGHRLIFSEGEFVTPGSMFDLLADRRPGSEMYFAGRPIFILNACESGTGGTFPTTESAFPGTVIDMGARGVVATEAPVPAVFGVAFANRLLEEFLSGKDMAAAIRSTRLAFMRKGNPGGLLYSYHGNPSTRLAISFEQ